MDKNWFRRFGWFHLPVSVPGAVVTLTAVLFCFNVFLAFDRQAGSASETLFQIFPYFICTFLLHEWIAEKTSRKRQH